MSSVNINEFGSKKRRTPFLLVFVLGESELELNDIGRCGLKEVLAMLIYGKKEMEDSLLSCSCSFSQIGPSGSSSVAPPVEASMQNVWW
jgi:hypothetical protein